MAYSAKLNGTTFFSTLSDAEEFLLSSAKLKKEAGTSGTFTFTIPPCNQYYNSFHKLTDYVDVYRDDDIIFSGRVYSIKETFDTQLTIECESLIAVLNDSILRPCKYENTTARDVFRAIIGNHNNQVENDKKLNIGTITVDDNACYRDYQKIETTLKRINDLSESYDGRIEVRRESDGLYIDWLKAYTDGVDQVINFGENILDIERKEDASAIITHLIPYGAKDSDGNPIDIKSENSGIDYVSADPAYIEAYGHVWATKTWNDVTVPYNLLVKAQNYVNACCVRKLTIKVKAVDLADAGLAADNFDTGQLIKVKSAYHGLDGGNDCWFECNKISINLLDPTSNTLELGATVKGYVQSKRNTTSEQQRAIEEIAETYLPKSELDSAVEQASGLITGNEGGYVVIHDSDLDGYPDEILIMSTPNIESAPCVWRWNKSGLGYSSNGYGGKYGTAITMEGVINANYITAGTMSADRLRTGKIVSQTGDTWWDLDSGILNIGSSTENDKSKCFVRQPTTPYYLGDLWVTNQDSGTAICDYAIVGKAIAGKDGTQGVGGTILVCKNTRTSGDYVVDDWVLLTNYYDNAQLDNILSQVAQCQIDIARTESGLALKADGSTVDGLVDTVSLIEGDIDVLRGDVDLKASYSYVDETVGEKSKVYRVTPTVPYSFGDLWLTTSADSMNAFCGVAKAGNAIASFGNDIYTCVNSKNEYQTFSMDDWVKATDYKTEAQLNGWERRINQCELDINAAEAAIALKAESTTVNDLGTRVVNCDIRLDAQKAEIESCVKDTDYNGETIASKITQSPTTVQIDARHINLNGYVTANEHFKIDEHGSVEVSGNALKNHCYTQEDYDRVRDIIMGTVTPTDSDYELYDINNDGRITSLDFLSIRSIINNHIGYYSTETKIIPDTLTDNIVVSNNLGDETIIGPQSVKAQNLKGMRLSLSEPMFKISTVSIGPLTLSGSAYQVYSEEGEKEISATEGYEIVGTSGFSIRPADSSSTAIMCNVWKAYCDVIVNSGSSENRRLVYGITNTGVSDQTIYVDFYLMEAHTREKFNR